MPPPILYGTAWKKDRTADLVEMALAAGFRGVDTACQPRHYHEPGVGEGLARAYERGLQRSELYLQTKYTPEAGQDPDNIPYDPRAPLAEQVATSCEQSLKNLHTDQLDALLMHSPLPTSDETLTAWQAMENLVAAGKVQRIGISNCYDLGFLQTLWQAAQVKPEVLQNRFYKDTAYDVDIRGFCRDHGITYQSFWTLTANPHILESEAIGSAAAELGKTSAQVWFAYLIQHGLQPITGTSSEEHMRQDLAAPAIKLNADQCAAINKLGPFF